MMHSDHAPPRESSLQRPHSAKEELSAPAAQAPPITDNLAWASLIKEQHRYLQGAVHSTSAMNTVATSAADVECTTVPPLSPLPFERDLQVWRTALEGEEAARRLSAYSTAMHHLATQYWDPVASSETNSHPSEGKSSQEVGVKRPRSEGEEGSNVRTVVAAGKEADGVAPRHYSDRLHYCLWSTASYFLGEVVDAKTVRTPVESVSTPAPSTEAGTSAATAVLPGRKAPPTPLIVPVNDVAYSQLPGVMARVVKSLRRAFFDAHKRMATGREVGAMIAACTPSQHDKHPGRVTEIAGNVKEEEKEDSITKLIASVDPSAETSVSDAAWRRGAGAAWAAALRYTHSASLAADASASAVPPLHVLDVGSCYGPFYGKELPRQTPLPPVPLHVTSIDLAPYHAAVQDGGTQALCPRVWQGDWLHMKFFSTEEEKGSGGGEVQYAEEGRVQCAIRARSPVEASPLCSRPQHATDAKREAETAKSVESPMLEKTVEMTKSAHVNERDTLSATALRLESFDAVYFCLLLSYMPTPRLRFLACLHAFLALKEGGLLVVVSTRTQGSRRRNWMQEWATCLSTIGFQRVQQSTQEKIVGMAFARVCPSRAVHEQLRSADGRAAWVRALMATEAAETGLRITADDAQDRAEI